MDGFKQKSTLLNAMVYDRDARPETIDQLWNAPETLVDAGKKLVHKKCVRTTVKLDSAEDTFVIKRHRERSWRHFAKQCFTRSRAAKCWNDTWFLINHGYPTPRPIAYLENRLGMLRGNSYYVYRYVEGKTLKELATGLKNQRLLRQYVTQLVGIWKLHRNLRVNLHDGHPANFVVDAAGKMWVIDLDKLQRIPPSANVESILAASFEAAVKGVIGDKSVIQFAVSRLRESFGEPNSAAA